MKEKGALLACPEEGNLTQHHATCWSVIWIEGDRPVASTGHRAICSVASRAAG